MADEHQNAPNELDTLLSLSPEEVLRAIPLDIRHKLGSLRSALTLLEDKTFAQEEHDEILKIAQRSANDIDQMLNLIGQYFTARDEMKNAEDNQLE